jgi:hypothetical protein
VGHFTEFWSRNKLKNSTRLISSALKIQYALMNRVGEINLEKIDNSGKVAQNKEKLTDFLTLKSK